ncbi:MAG: Crp/Fnr family transcriptional regulator [Reyranellaceae bacterium]
MRPASDREPLALRDGRIVTIAAGQTLFRQGDPATALYLVEAGCLRLERHTQAGAKVVVHTARAGELLAEGALAADAYHCDAVAAEDSRLRRLDKAALLAGLEEGSPQHGLLLVLARQLLRARRRIELSNVRSAGERVMLYLEQQADAAGRVPLPGELQDLAAELGLSRETLYRTLARLRKDRRVRRLPGALAIVRP